MYLEHAKHENVIFGPVCPIKYSKEPIFDRYSLILAPTVTHLNRIINISELADIGRIESSAIFDAKPF